MTTIAPGKSISLPLSNPPIIDRSLDLLWIPPGVFTMGSPEKELGRIAEEEQQFQVRISRGFWLSKYLVTQAQWWTIKHNNPSCFQQQNFDCPVENINWSDAIGYCQELNKLFGGNVPAGYRFSLPTEAQWEYACRAGTQTIYYNGDKLNDLSQAAWHKGNSLDQTHSVGEKEPNVWGLYDMLGNVFEWCYDSFSDYPSSPAVDWEGDENSRLRILRGGSGATTPDDSSIRCAGRGYADLETRRPWFGFRVSLRAIEQASHNIIGVTQLNALAATYGDSQNH